MSQEARPLSVPPQVRQLLLRLRRFWRSRGVDAYVIGGFVRDLLLRREPRDIDVSVSGNALELARIAADDLGGRWVPLHEEHAVARVVLPHDSPVRYVDVAALRGDVNTDLAERDFTVDAVALHLDALATGKTIELIDPFDGQGDLERRLVRATGPDVFRADSVRLLRAVRLCAELDFRLDSSTAELVRRDVPHLREAAAERQRDELSRIFETPRAAAGLKLLEETGLLDILLPEVTVARGVSQPKEHFWDVLRHLIETVAALDMFLAGSARQEPARASLWRELWARLEWVPGLREHFQEEMVEGRTRGGLLKLAGLLHDISKPETKKTEETGRIRFFGHPQRGAKRAEDVVRRLRYSNSETRLVAIMVREHMRPMQLGVGGPPTRRALYRFFRDMGEAAFDVLFLSLADNLAARGPKMTALTWRRSVAYVDYLLRRRESELLALAPPRLLTGHDLIAEFGLEPGPLIGWLLDEIEEARATGEIDSRGQALELARRLLDQRQRSMSHAQGRST